MIGEFLFLAIILGVISAVILWTTVVQIQQYEAGVLLVLGKLSKTRPVLLPGWNLVIPLVSSVAIVDLRTQVLDVPRQEVITKDNSPTMVDAVVYYRVGDPLKAILEVQNFRSATIQLSQTTLRAVIGDMELDQVLSSRDTINHQLRDRLDVETDRWGVQVESVEIREVDPSPNVKKAMEEQTSAERERRAAILKADGVKRSAILVAEGDKQSRILEAEGQRQSRILEAEGERMGIILEKQGEAQGLRITAVGAAPLDSKALTVLSLEAVKKLGEGESTKFVVPFEITKLMEGISDYVGFSRNAPDREIADAKDLEANDILGAIPTQEEMQETMKEIREEVDAAAVAVEGSRKQIYEEPSELEEPKV